MTIALTGCVVADIPPDIETGAPKRPGRTDTDGVAETFAGHAPGYTIEAVPTGISFGRSRAGKAICARDAVVGDASISSLSDEHAILFDANGMTDLGTLGGRVSRAHDGNVRGTIVGTASTAGPFPGSSGPGHAFVDREGVMTDLGVLGGLYSEAWAINEREQIVGNATITVGGDVPNHAVLWETCGTTIDLGTLGGTDSWARGINDAGVIVGASLLPSGRARAVVWDDRVIADLGAHGSLESQGLAINGAGTVAGFTRSPDRAVLWDNGAFVDLGTLGGTHALALGLNDRGEVVGASTEAGDQSFRAFLYAQGTMADLNNFVDQGVWQLLEATDVCNDGRIVGNGMLDGVPRGFVLTPDHP